MKKTLLCVLLSLVTLLAGCTQDEPYEVNIDDLHYRVDLPAYTESEDKPLPSYVLNNDRFQYFQDNLYFYRGISGSDMLNKFSTVEFSTLIRLNTKTGVLTNICPDPLCRHNSPECPFAGYLVTCNLVEGNTYIYVRDYRYIESTDPEKQKNTPRIRQLCSYDLANMEMTVHKEWELTETNGAFRTAILYHNRCIYYEDNAYVEESGTYEKRILRINMDTNQEEVLGDPSSGLYSLNYLFLFNGRIYFTDGKTLYSTNTDMGDKQIHAEGKFAYQTFTTDGKYIYYGVMYENNPDEHLYRLSLDGGKPEELGIVSVGGWQITEKYIYYVPPERVTLFDDNGKPVNNFFSTQIVRCLHDGSNPEIVIDTKELINAQSLPELENADILQLMQYKVVGNYLFADYVIYYDQNDNFILNSADGDELYINRNDPTENHSIFCFNLETGEAKKLLIPNL